MDPVTLGMAKADARKKYAATNVGDYVPAGWGATWKAKRDAAKAGTGLARIATVGDSVTAGYFASSPAASWSWKLRDLLQPTYGNGGSGFHTTADSGIILAADGQPAALTTAWNATGKNCVTAGSSFHKVPWTDGPGFTPLQMDAADSTATFKVNGSVIEVFYLKNVAGAGFGTLRVVVDGGAPTDVDTGAGPKGIGVTTINVAAGDHTVVVSTPTGVVNTTSVYLCGVSARNATGLVMDRYAHGGHPSTAVNNVPSATFPGPSSYTYGGGGSNSFGAGGKWSGGSLRPCDLAIYSMGLNDSRSLLAISADQYRTNVRAWLDDICSQAAPPAIMFLAHHPGSGVDDTKQLHIQLQHLRALAEVYGAAIVNMWPKYQNSYAVANAQGYWGSATNPGPTGNDLVHPSDAGHLAIANAVKSVITA